jgi:hypothetical protein
MVVYVDLSTNPQGVTIIAVLWSFMGLSGIFLSLRLYSKLMRSRWLWWDDYFIIVAWVWFTRVSLSLCSLDGSHV